MAVRFAKVDSNLYRGGRPSKEDLNFLKDKCGVERIVSLDGDVASEIHPHCNMLELEHVVIPIEGDFPEENIDKVANNVDDLLSSKKTYVHCFHGKDRTGMACAMYRIANGMDTTEALVEAQRFGMGSGLSPKVKKMYYDAVVNFARNRDSNDAGDTVAEVAREQTAIVDLTPTEMNHDVSSPYQLSFAPFADPKRESTSPVMNVSASQAIYVLSTPSQIMMPQQWFTRDQALKQLPGEKGHKLYSAEIHSNSDVFKSKRNYNRTLLQSAKIDGRDAVFFPQNVIFILNPSALINIREEYSGDSNHVGDVPEVGQKTNYTGLAPYSFPGSGGMMESGYGGFAAPVQLPLDEF